MGMFLIQQNIFETFSLSLSFLSVENTRIDVEKCGNEHSEQMLILLALLQDNRSRRGVADRTNDEEEKKDKDEKNSTTKKEKHKLRRGGGVSDRGFSDLQVFS